ncbi:hypothetical protein HZA55_10345 [Candidatus Poribacteria bacterium]|nr:hypothetical protein [Candidatus Poribacteria bacterium]
MDITRKSYAYFDTGCVNTPGDANGLYVSGNYAYIVDGKQLKSIDITNPVNPFIVDILDIGEEIWGLYIR